MDYTAGDNIKIFGERTVINFQTWNENKVDAQIEIISKHEIKRQARRDLDVLNVVFEKKGKSITYSNSIQINENDEKPKSNIKVYLTLMVPENASLEVTNKFGEIIGTGTLSELEITSQFCTSVLDYYAGNMYLNTKYDDIKIEHSKGEFEIEGDRTDIKLLKVSGKVDLDLEFGSIDVTYSPLASRYSINSEYSPITIYLPSDLKVYQEYNCKNCLISTDRFEKKIKKTNNLILGSPKNSISRSKINSKSKDINIISINQISNLP